jgi:hypothetical protein
MLSIWIAVRGLAGAAAGGGAGELEVAGAMFARLVFQFVLAWSGWRYISIAPGETYEALLVALWELRGVPARIQQNNLSAATHDRVETSGRTLTKRFAEVVEHYDFESSRIQPGEAHENGVAEKRTTCSRPP